MKKITLNSIRNRLDKDNFNSCMVNYNGTKMIRVQYELDTFYIAVNDYSSLPLFVNKFSYIGFQADKGPKHFSSINNVLDYIHGY